MTRPSVSLWYLAFAVVLVGVAVEYAWWKNPGWFTPVEQGCSTELRQRAVVLARNATNVHTEGAELVRCDRLGTRGLYAAFSGRVTSHPPGRSGRASCSGAGTMWVSVGDDGAVNYGGGPHVETRCYDGGVEVTTPSP